MAYRIRSHHKRTGCLDIAENLICLLIIQIKVNPAVRDVCLASFKRIKIVVILTSLCKKHSQFQLRNMFVLI